MAQQMRVYKTLVIGLGSTGTEILETLAERVDWEVGSLERAPWLQFLAVETDVAKASRFNGKDDFKTLSIPAASWRDILHHPENYDDSIALSSWADTETLNQLPAQSVSSGAGHIRMVGRLALLYPPNYNEIKNAINARLSRLRSLTEADAKAALNTNNTGSPMDVQFAVNEGNAQTGIRVIVVGTLCGGTCSGSVSDIGILLRTVLQNEENAIAMLTLPHPDISIAQKPDAEVWKTNAYHALAELNQYHNHQDRERYRSIKYPDKAPGQPVLPSDAMPYDLVYLLRPASTQAEDLDRLSQAIADRMFLNVFVPETDPMAYMVNAGPVHINKGQAFAFSTFGLSTIEYPLRRISEALKYRTLVYAVDQWKDRPYEGRLDEELDTLGLTIPALTEALLLDANGASVRSSLDAKLSEVKRAALNRPEQARQALSEFRGAFEIQKGEGLRGLVYATTVQNRRRAAENIMQSVQGLVGARLLDYDQGPNALLSVMEAVGPRVGDLRGWEPGEGKTGAANGVLDQLSSIQSNTLLGLFGLKRKAALRLMPALSRALDEELRSRINTKVKDALRDTGSGQRTENGVLSLIAEDSQKIAQRLSKLRSRLANQADLWRMKKVSLETEQSRVNGLSLFAPSPQGTVDREEELMLAGDSKKKDRQSAQLLRGWTSLVRGVLPQGSDPDWLLAPWTPGQNNFERQDLNTLESRALEPFDSSLRAVQKDVVSRLQDLKSPQFDPGVQAMSAASRAQLFLGLNAPMGQIDAMSPLPNRKLLVGMQLTPQFREAILPWTNTAPQAREAQGIDPYRVVMLEEWFRFSLRGADDVRNLAFAQPSRFNTYFTRRRSDIDWTPINEAEIKKLEQAEQLVFLAALHGVLRLEGGHLVMDWPETVGEQSDPAKRVRRLPGSFAKAARKLAFDSRDDFGKQLINGQVILKSEMDARIRTVIGRFATPQEGRRGYVTWLRQELQGGNARAVKDWNDRTADVTLSRYLTADPELQQALLEVANPPQTMIDGLYRSAGSRLPNNRIASKDGYYCQDCGGPLGSTSEEVISGGLKCSYYPENASHPFGQPYSLFPETLG
jgi:Tubulin like